MDDDLGGRRRPLFHVCRHARLRRSPPGGSRERLGKGLVVTVASLRDVIRSKEAAGRDKDLAQLPLLRRTLEQIRERQRSSEP
jgi:hypothetical protein